MKKALFNELIGSIQQAGKIHRGELKPSREIHFDLDIKILREKISVTQKV